MAGRRYRRFINARHQSCLAHLLRRCRLLHADHPRSPWAARVQAVLNALALRDAMRRRSPIKGSPWPMGACSPA